MTEEYDATRKAVAKLPPGAVVVSAMKFTHGTVHELINWQKREGYKYPVIAASLTNILNKRSYNYTTYSQLSSFESQRQLRGRQLLFSITLRK